MKVFIFYAQHAAPAVFIFYAQHAAPAVTLQCAKLGGDSNILTSPTPRLSTLAMHFMCSDFSEEASFRRYELRVFAHILVKNNKKHGTLSHIPGTLNALSIQVSHNYSMSTKEEV